MATNQSDGVALASDQRYRHLFEHVPICIFVTDLTVTPAIILEVNRRTELVYGYTSGELVGKPAALLVPEEARSLALTIVQRARQGKTVTAETTHRHRDGTTFPARIMATLDPTHSGHMIVTVEDITAEKRRWSEAEAIDAERLRIAHDVHDGVAQSLAALRLKTALWSHLAPSAPPAMQTALDEVQDVLKTAIADMRRAIFALLPIDPDTLGFFPALTQLVADTGDQYQLLARLEVSGPQDALPATYAWPLFRIIQEGLYNISQHAYATAVVVRLDMDAAGGTAVSVRDNGRGFDPRQLDPGDHVGHSGLRQMREGIVDLGGTLDIRSALGQGTELVITLPPVVHGVKHVTD
jgi:two-component system, NarL family, sensor histidine kinase NreB